VAKINRLQIRGFKHRQKGRKVEKEEKEKIGKIRLESG